MRRGGTGVMVELMPLLGLVGRLVGDLVLSAVLAGAVIDADVVVPVGVHEAVVAVAEGASAEGLLGGAWHLDDARALVQHRRAVVVTVVVAAVIMRARMRRRDVVRRRRAMIMYDEGRVFGDLSVGLDLAELGDGGLLLLE